MKRERLFPRLDPPRGGLEALRTKIEAEGHRRRFKLGPALGFVACAALLALFVVLSRQSSVDLVAAARQPAANPAGLQAFELGLLGEAPAPVAVSDDARTTQAARRVPTSNPDVAFYWVSSTAWGEKAEAK